MGNDWHQQGLENSALGYVKDPVDGTFRENSGIVRSSTESYSLKEGTRNVITVNLTSDRWRMIPSRYLQTYRAGVEMSGDKWRWVEMSGDKCFLAISVFISNVYLTVSVQNESKIFLSRFLPKYA
jgi:hypothetical protein